MTTFHTPVMAETIIHHLVRPTSASPTYLDLTLGDGGHTEALLKAAPSTARVIGCDRDGEAIARASARLAKFGEQFTALHGNFSDCEALLRSQHVHGADGIVADLGVSSRQLDLAARGFSFRQEGPLDMRMDVTQGESAAALVNKASEEELADWFYLYGEERYSRRIARRIVAERAHAPIATTDVLADIVRRALHGTASGRSRGRQIDPATRTFQALRIVVNAEMTSLEQMLESAPRLLNAGAALAVISYHSLEDRLVKRQFRHCATQDEFAVVTKRPLTPSDAEIEANPRARSAKLRVLERLAA